MIDFDAAAAIVTALPPRARVETIALADAAERILAEPVFAAMDLPRYPISAMDGYAVRDADLARPPVRLRILGPVLPGETPPDAIAPGCCVRVFTGSRVPPGTDRVVLQEDVCCDGEEALFSATAAGRNHVRAPGSDLSASGLVLGAGIRLDARSLVAIAAADAAEVVVYRRPSVAIIATGDELCVPGSARGTVNGIPESVSPGVAALVRRWGGQCVHRIWLSDDIDQLEAAAGAATEMADLVVVIGGASVGDRDYARRMFAPLGLELLFSKVAMKPAKPVWLGKVADKLVLGLPGNPTSAMIAARLFLAPLLQRIGGGDAADALRWMHAPLTAPLEAGGERERFAGAKWVGGHVMPLPGHDSGAQAALIEAQLLLRVRAGTPALPAGALAEVLAF